MSRAYFEAEGVTLYCGEALATLAELAPPVDAFITDLPYGTTQCLWDSVIPLEPMWAQVKRLLKQRGAFVTTASQPFTSALVMSNLAWFKYEWIWDKQAPVDFLNVNKRPMRVHENILIFCDGLSTYNPQKTGKGQARWGKGSRQSENYGKYGDDIKESVGYPRDIIKIRRQIGVIDGEVYHPTQKPVALYDYLIRTYTNPGDLVCDFCAGSGTTGVAAIRTGRRVILIEQAEQYCEIAARRLERELQQPRLLPIADVTTPAAQGGLW